MGTVALDGLPYAHAIQPKRLALLVYLSVASPRRHRRDSLLPLLWPVQDDTSGRTNLRQALSGLRRILPRVIETHGEDITVSAHQFQCDVWNLERAFEQGHYLEAVRVYRGPFLGGFYLKACPDFEAWAERERHRVADMYKRALERIAEAESESSRAVEWWRRLADQDPYSTRVAVRLMKALDEAGNRAAAIQHAEGHAARLRNDLAAEPSADVEALASQFRTRSAGRSRAGGSTDQEIQTAIHERYTILRELGAGGTGNVYLAEDNKHDRRVAIKFLRPELAAALGPERFLEEIAITAKLRHPHILPLLDSGNVDGRLFYVMPYVEGETLRDRLTKRGPLRLDEAISIGVDVAEALEHAHAQGVIHRDIKPENILLERRHAIVADFGIAIARGGATGPVSGDGTPAYMSPEQSSGKGSVQAPSDIYSLTRVFHEMVSGVAPTRPSPSDRIGTTFNRNRVDEGDGWRRDAPKAVVRLVDWGTAQSPEDRPSATEFRLALSDALDEWKILPGARMRRRALLATITIAVLVIVTAVRSYVTYRQRDWARTEGIEELERLARSTDEWDNVYRLGMRLASIIPNDPNFLDTWHEKTIPTDIRTDPPGAVVYRRSYNDPDTASVLLGVTPLTNVRLPLFASRLRIELRGYRPKHLVVWTAPNSVPYLGRSSLSSQVLTLDAVEDIPANMVRVSGFNLPELSLGLDSPIGVPDFLLDKLEVTNREYKEFIDAGGYRDSTYWTQAFVRDGDTLAWRDGIGYLVDQSYQPGPSIWTAGSYPEGTDNHPVGGLSWFEAMAYARFAGKDLPTYWHWRQALPSQFFHLVIPNSNIARSDGILPVGSLNGLGAFGTLDQAGNVREWTYNRVGNQRLIVGGSWFDPAYVARNQSSVSPWDRSPVNGLRLASFPRDTSSLKAARRVIVPIPRVRDYTKEKPASETEVAFYASLYDYDREPLLPLVETVDTTRDWVRERVSFAAPYGSDQRLTAYLYVPRHGKAPFQTVVYWPGDFVMYTSDVNDVPDVLHEFFVTAGRAVILPVFNGTLDREPMYLGGALLDVYRATEGNRYKDLVIQWIKDFRRTIDYVSTRSDLDSSRIAYYGFSWGGRFWPIVARVEPRIKAVITYVAGLNNYRTLPEIDQFNFLPYVTVPLKMLAGRYDDVFSLELMAQPMFRLAGTPSDQKDFYIYEGSHFIPADTVASAALGWLDDQLGRPR